nr:MAG TPA: hypothetical protein [Caudoviricetes sp.]
MYLKKLTLGLTVNISKPSVSTIHFFIHFS